MKFSFIKDIQMLCSLWSSQNVLQKYDIKAIQVKKRLQRNNGELHMKGKDLGRRLERLEKR